ncbi:MAG: phosphoribosylformylglycinamidine synthase subunit PurS [Planctomycetota bacterium]|nr:phosphoribosylformylglycinamidine synthase subunit PurS [Planctomycetota bacterium]
MVYRIDVRARNGGKNSGSDSAGAVLRNQVAELGLKIGPISTSRIFLIETNATLKDVERIGNELLADSIVEEAAIYSGNPSDSGHGRIEVHLKPGVMDPVAASTEMAIRDMGIHVGQVRTGRAYLIEGNLKRDQLQQIATRLLANGVIESIHFDAYCPLEFETGHDHRFELRNVNLRTLTDEQLTKLSREAHLFLSLPEMKVIQRYFRSQEREPTDIELETLAQTWSEHCVHKTLKSAVEVEVRDGAEKILERRRYGNLIKETIFASTMELMSKEGRDPFCLSVFKDNAGVVAFDETDAVCFKVETHNHPSAIEPYGGSATGAGGVIRDVLGTGLAAKPIANTDIFCVAFPDFGKSNGASLPRGVTHPKRILQQVVAGVRDYGNRMGIPTVNGAVYFDDRYLGNPLVFCGCVGLIPRNKISKAAVAGDAIVVMGGRTGRDGIHGATFSSAELTDTHADEFSHAVQIGNAITEKKVADVILAARDLGLFTGVTDCGAGGLSSAVGEMGEKTGAVVDLEKVPLKYAGLRYDEIWISEAQERMVLSVPAKHINQLLSLAAAEDVEATVIGTFGTDGQELVLNYRGQQVGRLGMEFLHNGIPTPTRKAVVVRERPDAPRTQATLSAEELKTHLLAKLAHPNIASKHWIIRQYDHEVQGGSVIKPLTGPDQRGPSDAAVIRPKLTSYRGIALGCGMAPQIADPYDMALASIDEAIRNVVAVGADPNRIAILDNFCWPSVDDEKTMGTLVRACEACRDAALAYRIPFISGKDSLHNQFTIQETGEVLRIPRTLLISAMGVIEDVRQCVTMDLKKPGNSLTLVRTSDKSPVALANLHRLLSQDIRAGHIAACHDVSEGGALVAAAEMCIASGLGLELEASALGSGLFNEPVGEYLVEWNLGDSPAKSALGADSQAECVHLGKVVADTFLTINSNTPSKPLKIAEADLRRAWLGTLDW